VWCVRRPISNTEAAALQTTDNAPLKQEDQWVEKLDLTAFAADIKALGKKGIDYLAQYECFGKMVAGDAVKAPSLKVCNLSEARFFRRQTHTVSEWNGKLLACLRLSHKRIFYGRLVSVP
jgi:hypothetical protein